MDNEEHIREYKRIIAKYSLGEECKAEEIAIFLTKKGTERVYADEFATLFGMKRGEAVIFLSFIEKGIQFRNRHMVNG